MSASTLPPFDALDPNLAVEAAAEAWGLALDGTFETFPSYVNRVFGFRDEEGRHWVAKFYRPGRWSLPAIAEEHAFLAELAAEDAPVAAPVPGLDGSTLQLLEIEEESGSVLEVPFALWPKKSGRGFDAESESDWLRLGALAGRVHSVGARRAAPFRRRLAPGLLRADAEALLGAGVVHPDCRGEFVEALELAEPRVDAALEALPVQRIHGDFHRGNILDRGPEGLLLVDFDDMATGPAVQDLWLLLPDHAAACRRELALVLEGYAEFRELPAGSVAAVESLRFLRMVSYLAWQARQRADAAFPRHFPDWGGRAFWLRECADLLEQARLVADGA